MAAYGLGRAPYPGVGGYSGECVLFVRLGGTRSLFTRLRLKMREEKKTQEKSKKKLCSPATTCQRRGMDSRLGICSHKFFASSVIVGSTTYISHHIHISAAAAEATRLC